MPIFRILFNFQSTGYTAAGAIAAVRAAPYSAGSTATATALQVAFNAFYQETYQGLPTGWRGLSDPNVNQVAIVVGHVITCLVV